MSTELEEENALMHSNGIRSETEENARSFKTQVTTALIKLRLEVVALSLNTKLVKLRKSSNKYLLKEYLKSNQMLSKES